MKALILCSLLLSFFAANAAESTAKPAEVQMEMHYFEHKHNGQIFLPNCARFVSFNRGNWGTNVLVRKMDKGDKPVTYVISNSQNSEKLWLTESCKEN